MPIPLARQTLRLVPGRLLPALAALLLAAAAIPAALAQTITPVTWNIVGLDSNNVNVGPNKFPVGVRICNTTGVAIAASTRQAKFNWVPAANPYITLTSPELLPIPALAIGACQDIFHEVTITRSTSSYGAKAQYNIEVVDAVGASLPTPLRTPPNREIFVEQLISQNRNQIDGYSYNGGSQLAPGAAAITIAVGQTFDLELRGRTATQGYEQLERFIELDSRYFRVNKVAATFAANAGTDPTAGTKIYADGCGWVNDTNNPNYRTNLSCTGVGKYGGVINHKYNITVIAAPAAPATSVYGGSALYDFSGSSYHYNGDFDTGGITFNFGTPPAPVAADLAMGKSMTFSGNGNYTFNLSVTNLGPASATGVVVTDTVPSTCYTIDNNQGSGWAGTLSGNTVTWNVGTLALGATQTLPIKVNRRANGTGCTNVACVASSSTDPNSANNCAEVVANTVVSDLAVTKTVSKAAPVPGESVTFTVTVKNQGTDDAPNVRVTDAVPNGYTVTAATPNLGTFVAPTWTIPTLAIGATATLTITATVNDSGTYLNSASATSDASDPDLSNNTATAAVQPTYLSIAKTTSDTFSPGTAGKTFAVTVSKTGNANVGTITVADVLPFGMTLTAISGTGWSCTLATASCTRVDDISATTGFPIAYPAITVTVTVTDDAPAQMTNFVSASSTNGSYAEATRIVSSSTSPDMSISLSGLPTTASLGVAYTGTFTCSNIGTAEASAGTTCSVTGLPAGTSVTGCTINTATPAPAWVDGNAVPIGAVVTCSVSGTPTTSGNVTVNGSTGATGDLITANNTASLGITVNAPDMAISLSALPTSATVGTAYAGTYRCTNVGAAAASAGTTCAVSGLPAGTSVTGCTINTATPAPAWVAGNAVPVGAVVTCSVAGTPTTAGNVTVNGSTGATGDTNAPNNTDSLAISVVAAAVVADLEVTKTVNKTLPAVGEAVTFTVTVKNLGPGIATNVVLTDAVPNGYAVTSATPSTGSWAPPTWTIASLAVNATATLTVSATVNASGAYLNSATATSDATDPNPANNTATAAAQPTYLAITKTTTDTFAPGNTGKTFTVTVSKTGNASLGTLTVTDVVPLGMTLTGLAGSGWSCTVGTGVCTRADDISATTGFPIAYPAITVTVSVAASPPASMTNFVSVSASSGSSYAEATRSVVTVLSPDMAISLSALPATATVGTAYSGTYTCTNVGTAAASAGTTCAVSGLPTGVSVSGCTINTATPAPAWSAGNAVPVNAVVTCNVSGTPTAAANTTVNGSTGATGDTNAPNNTASIALTVAPLPTLMSITKTTTDTFPANSVGRVFTVTVSKTGNVNLGTVTVTDTPPIGMTITAMSGNGWACNYVASTCTRSDDISATTGFPIAYPPITVIVNVAANAPPEMTNVVSVSSAAGSASAGASRTVATAVEQPAQIPTLSQWAMLVMALLLGWGARQRFVNTRR